MAYTGILTTEAEIAIYAGENVDATGNTEANRNLLVAQIESYVNLITNYNFTDNYSTLNADTKKILNEFCARAVAVGLISYNMAGYTSRIEAEDMINIHLYRMDLIEKILRDDNMMKRLRSL